MNSPTAAISGQGKEFRSHLAGVLLYRGLMEALYGGSGQAAGSKAPACLTKKEGGTEGMKISLVLNGGKMWRR